MTRSNPAKKRSDTGAAQVAAAVVQGLRDAVAGERAPDGDVELVDALVKSPTK
jgi:hypothetical protein